MRLAIDLLKHELITLHKLDEDNRRSNRRKTITEGTEMATLTMKKRNKLPKKDFGLPKSEKYPMPDKSHAANAKARATQMVKKGKLSAASKAKIDAKANRILGKKKNTTTKKGM